MQLNTCILSDLLTRAKDAHTRYERRFKEQGDTPPDHKWEDWYARYIMHELAEQEINSKWRAISPDEESTGKALSHGNTVVVNLRENSDGFADVTGPQPDAKEVEPRQCPWGSAP